MSLSVSTTHDLVLLEPNPFFENAQQDFTFTETHQGEDPLYLRMKEILAVEEQTNEVANFMSGNFSEKISQTQTKDAEEVLVSEKIDQTSNPSQETQNLLTEEELNRIIKFFQYVEVNDQSQISSLLKKLVSHVKTLTIIDEKINDLAICLFNKKKSLAKCLAHNLEERRRFYTYITDFFYFLAEKNSNLPYRYEISCLSFAKQGEKVWNADKSHLYYRSAQIYLKMKQFSYASMKIKHGLKLKPNDPTFLELKESVLKYELEEHLKKASEKTKDH